MKILTYLKRLLPGLAVLAALGLGTLYGEYVQPFDMHAEPSGKPIPQAMAVLALRSLEDRATEERSIVSAGLEAQTRAIGELRADIGRIEILVKDQAPKPKAAPAPIRPKKQPTAWASTVKPGAPRSTVAK